MRRALGKGLSQLLGEEEVVAHPTHVDVNGIQASPRQPRKSFDRDGLEELAASILEVGVLLPLIVRPVTEGKYELIALPLKLVGFDASPVRAVLRTLPQASP